MAVSILLLTFVFYERSYDTQHDNLDRLYRLRYERISENGEAVRFASCCPPAAVRIRDNFTQVKDIARIFKYRASVMYGENKYIEDRMFFAEPDVFKLISFNFLEGDPVKGLVRPNTAFFSKSAAEKYFGKENPVGKVFSIDNKTDYTITGVYEDMPQNSHLKCDILLSFPNLEDIYGPLRISSWGETGFFTYLTIKDGESPEKLQEELAALVDREFGEVLKEYKMEMLLPLQPVKDIHLTSHFMQEYEVNGNAQSVNILLITALFILVIAWVNYINLTTARSLNRAKEIGLRKVAGASRGHVMAQLFTETLLVNLLALVISILLVLLFLPSFNQLTGMPAGTNPFGESWFHILLPAIFILGVLFSGLYPVLIISRYEPSKVLKGKFANTSSGMRLRKILVSFQFVMALFLIIATYIIYSQINFMKTGDTGFDSEQTLVVKLPRVKGENFETRNETFKQKMLSISGLEKICVGSETPGRQILWDAGGIYKYGEDISQSKNYQIVGVDYDYADLFGLEIIAGRNFSKEYPSDNMALMMNETAAEWMGFDSPAEAIGQQVQYWDKVYKIVGVVKDYHQQSLKEEFEPHLFRFMPHGLRTLGVYAMKINSADIAGVVGAVEKTFSEFYPESPFEYYFMDEYYNQQYKSDELFGEVFLLFSFLAIFITSLGIFGLSAFSAAQRTKEIGIRKVLGADIHELTTLLAKDFFIILIISFIITFPAAYYASVLWLKDFAMKVPVSFRFFLIPLLIVAAITLATISWQTIKTALVNPAISLRDE